MTKLRPAGFQAPYPAWGPERPPRRDYLLAQVGVQSRSASPVAGVFDEIGDRLAAEPGLLHVERVSHLDDRAAHNEIAVTYWESIEALRAWVAPGGALQRLADAAAGGPVGLWCEWLAAPATHFEASGSTPDAAWGMSRHLDTVLEDDHAYWGAMRDRISAAEDGGLASHVAPLERQPPAAGGRWRIALPANMCLIRTVQGYSEAPADELASYEAELRPEYERGVRHLADHPVESRCLSARLVRNHDPGPGRPDTETLAWFASLADLENWVHHHPTHAAIFAAGQAHSVRFAPDQKLLLGHEVAVTVAGAAEALYFECHPGTGLLPFLPAEPA